MVSVLIPVYNRNKELTNLLESFVVEFHSNRNDFEIIIIDDDSSDGSYEIAKQYTLNYNFFKLLTSGYRSPGMSRNIGAKSAKYDWLLYCDSDNLMVQNWTNLLYPILNKYQIYDGIWFPAQCNNIKITSVKYLNKGCHEINSFYYFNNYIGEVVHCIKKDFLLKNNYFYLKGTSNDFPDLLWFSLFSNNSHKIYFYDLIIQKYIMSSENRISSDISLEKNYSQIIHYKMLLFKIFKSKYIFTKYFVKIVIKFFFFIVIVDDRKISLKNDVGLLRWLSKISHKIGMSQFLLSKLNKKRKLHEGTIC
jgi:glycosyltransferase involved in cell wall biosynthesis